MRHIGTARKLVDLGHAVIAHGHSTQQDHTEAAFEIPETWALVCADDSTFISVDDWFSLGCPLVNVWSTEPAEERGLQYENIDLPRNGWGAISGRIKRAALAWQEDIHGQDGALRLAVLLSQLEGEEI
jgi:hypothetical protein